MAQPTQAVTVPQPAFRGLNKEKQQVLQDPSWCIEAQNAVIDGAGRLAARKGRDQVTSSAVESGAVAIRSVHEYLQTDGTSIIISGTTTKLYSGTTTLTDKTGACTVTAGKWQFANFNGNVYGWQTGHTPVVKIGAGNFAHLVAATGSLPAGNDVIAAFGRLWASHSDKQTIKYSALLDATKWDAADGAGSIDMKNVWTHGMDEIMAITAFGAGLVVFGKRHIVIWVDGSGSNIGLDPDTMYVGQTIEGVGCIARDSVQLVGEVDIMFWSDSGIRSLQRTLQEKATPINDISRNVRDFINGSVYTLATMSNVKSVYNPNLGFYLLIVPDASVTIYVDTKQPLEDGTYRVCEWPAFSPTAACGTVAGVTHFGSLGLIEQYAGYDDLGSAYRFVYRMPWTDSGNPNVLKYLKEIASVCLAPAGTPIVFKWWTDFKANVNSCQVDLDGGTFAEYNADALYSVAEFSGNISVQSLRVPVDVGSEHQYLSLGIEANILGFPFALQSVTSYIRGGRNA